MKTQLSRIAYIALILAAAVTDNQRAQAQDTNFYNTFIYQGRLAADFGPGWDDSPHTWDFLISVISPPAPCFGTDCGWFTNCNGCVTTVLGTNSVIVNKGLFTTPINMPTGRLANVNGLYLQFAVRTNGGGAFTTLWPAQRLTAAPYASIAQSVIGPIPASLLTGTMPTGMLTGIFSSPLSLINPGNVFAGDGSLLANVNATTIAGTNPCDLTCYWRLTGNGGTDPNINFLGTTDNKTVVFRANNDIVMRYQPHPNNPSIIGGYQANVILSGAGGAVICGGGGMEVNPPFRVLPNQIWNDGSAIVGGYTNHIRGRQCFIGGGWANFIDDVTLSNTHSAVISGGSNNYVNVDFGFIGGGSGNKVHTLAFASTIAGGVGNTASGGASSIAGGLGNTAGGGYGAIAGGQDNAIESLFSGYGSIGGGRGNRIITIAPGSTIGGGEANVISGGDGTISGGANNFIDQSTDSTIGGGARNTNSGAFAFIGGGLLNLIGSSAYYSVIGGGSNNFASGLVSTVAGGRNNSASGQDSTISGGTGNNSTSNYTTIGGGFQNLAAGQDAVVAGGSQNWATAGQSSIGGGLGNTVSGDHSTIAGGNLNTVIGQISTIAGGQENFADTFGTSIGGGDRNRVSDGADFSALGGGSENFIGRRILDLIELGFQTNHAYAAVLNGGVNNTNIGYYSTLGGGQNNTIVGPANNVEASHAVLAGGLHNQVLAPNAGTIGGGRDNVVNSDYAVVPGGRSASPNNYGQFAFAAGHMDNAGDAQASTFVLRRKFSGNGDLYLNGDTSDARVLIPPGAVWTLRFQVSAVSVTGTNFGSYEVSGVVAKIGATTTFVMMDGSGAVVGTARPIYETPGAAGWLATPYLNGDNSLRVAVFAGEAVKWSARIDVAEVRR